MIFVPHINGNHFELELNQTYKVLLLLKLISSEMPQLNWFH